MYPTAASYSLRLRPDWAAEMSAVSRGSGTLSPYVKHRQEGTPALWVTLLKLLYPRPFVRLHAQLPMHGRVGAAV